MSDRNDLKNEGVSRRAFLHQVGVGAAAAATVGTVGLPALGTEASAQTAEEVAREIGPLPGRKRANKSSKVRVDAAKFNKTQVAIPDHPDNGDEARYASKIGSYTKGLRHDPQTGEVDPAAYAAYLAAVQSGSHDAIEALVAAGHFGCPDPARQRRLVNPQSAFAFDLQGTDSHQLAMPPAPAFSSAEQASEMVELYWMALLRDVRFEEYETHPVAAAACDDLSQKSDFRAPKQNGRVTPQTLFRDSFPGCTEGPYLSQFMLQPAPYGAQRVDQRVFPCAPDVDFATTFDEWLDVQNGFVPTRTITQLDDLVFITNGRELSQYVHVDVLYQAYFVGFLVLAAGGYPLDPGNPYGTFLDGGSGRPLPVGTAGSKAQVGFGTFGGPAAATIVTEPATRALKAQWYQKWLVHRRTRPEEYGGRVEVQRTGRRSYPFHPELTSSPALDAVFSKHGSHLLPLAFPEGSPLHTSYGSGHATVAGASVTMLKAFFDEDAEIRNPVVPSADGRSLVPYQGPPLTVGGELNKLASNVSQGRNIAAVHWRTDATEAMRLGEAVAISILRDTRECYNETFAGFTLTKFDGTKVTV